MPGSTEWGEQFEDELKKNAIAYLNVDSSTSGADLQGDAIASLAPFLIETSSSFTDPVTKLSLRDAWANSVANKRHKEKSKAQVPDASPVNVRIGSGHHCGLHQSFLRREFQLLKRAGRDRQWHLEPNQSFLQPFHLL